MEEERSQQLGDRESPHAVPDLFEDLLLQESSEDGAPLGGTGRAEPSPRARERQEVLAPTAIGVLEWTDVDDPEDRVDDPELAKQLSDPAASSSKWRSRTP